jgi:hypothetical protein
MWLRVLRAVQALHRLVQRILREAILPSQRSKGAFALLRLCARDGTSRLPGRIGPHAPEPPLPLRQDRVIQLARGFQMGAQPLRLPCCHLEGQFQEKGRRPFLRRRSFRCAGLPRLVIGDLPAVQAIEPAFYSIHQVPDAVKHEKWPQVC